MDSSVEEEKEREDNQEQVYSADSPYTRTTESEEIKEDEKKSSPQKTVESSRGDEEEVVLHSEIREEEKDCCPGGGEGGEGGEGEGEGGGRGAEKDFLQAEAKDEEKEVFCWICYESFGVLVQTCKCSGSLSHVHEDCLLRWVDRSERSCCSVCLAPYDIVEDYVHSSLSVLSYPFAYDTLSVIILFLVFMTFHTIISYLICAPFFDFSWKWLSRLFIECDFLATMFFAFFCLYSYLEPVEMQIEAFEELRSLQLSSILEVSFLSGYTSLFSMYVIHRTFLGLKEGMKLYAKRNLLKKKIRSRL